VPLIAPQTLYEGRRSQVDLRIAKNFQLTPRYRLQTNFDFYNALNGNALLSVNNTYGDQWRRPQSILDGRLVQLSANLSF
jgi:hypothetical protein